MSETTTEASAGQRGLLKSTGLVSMMTMISRVFGLIRDMVIANFFGAGLAADVFFLAFRIPNLFRRLFAEGAFSQAFIPVLAEYKEKRTRAEVKDLVDKVSGTLGLNLVLVTLLGVVGAELVVSVFAAGYVYNGQEHKLALAVTMLRLTFPYLLLISMTAFCGAVLNTYGRFAAPAFTPVLLNLSLILCAVYLRPHMAEPVMALAWGVLIAGVAQLTFQLPFLASEGLVPVPKLGFRDEGVKKILLLMLPALFGVSVGQINLLIDTVLASFLETGSLSWLYYSDRLMELPLALFGITIATVILPSLSKEHHGNGDANSASDFSDTLNWAMRLVFLFGIPATLALIYLADSLIATLFYHGEMSVRDVEMASLSLMAYGLGLLGHMLVKVLAPGYFSRQDTRTPVRYGVIALVSNIVLNLILVWEYKHAGLALATSLSAFINAGLLFYGLARGGILRIQPGWPVFLARLLVANVALLALLVIVDPGIQKWLAFGFWERFAVMLLICTGGVVTYAASLLLVGYRFKEAVR